jgi:hypothetical protein
MNKRLGVGVFLLGLASCASEPVALNVDYLNGKTNYPPQPVATVLQSAPSGTYTPIARLTASGAPGITQEQVIGALQQRAQALGANAHGQRHIQPRRWSVCDHGSGSRDQAFCHRYHHTAGYGNGTVENAVAYITRWVGE